jgi:hypothetical protein
LARESEALAEDPPELWRRLFSEIRCDCYQNFFQNITRVEDWKNNLKYTISFSVRFNVTAK